MMKYQITYRMSLCLLFLTTILCGCVESTKISTTIKPTAKLPTFTLTLHSSSTPELVIFTPEDIPALTMETPLPKTVTPTITIEERKNAIVGLLDTNGGCKLPCWWGIMPGDTKWSYADSFLKSIGVSSELYSKETTPILYEAGSGIDFNEENIFNHISFYTQSDVVKYIIIEGEGLSNYYKFIDYWKHYTPQAILKTYGLPSRVWIYSIKTVHEGDPGPYMPYSLWVFYDQLGFLIRYNGVVEYKETYTVCPTFEDGGNLNAEIDLYLQSPERKAYLESMSDYEYYKDLIIPLDKATTLGVEDFYTLLTQEDQPQCFQTPRDIWY